MPFSPSDEILEMCDNLLEEVKRLQREARPIMGDGHIHEQVLVQSPDEVTEVDRGMVAILQRLWGVGVNTHMSCEDNGGCVWICFPLHDFLHLHRLARGNDDLAYFIDSCHKSFTSYTPEHFMWQFADDDDDEDDEVACPAMYHLNLRFPKRLKEIFEDLLSRIDLPPPRRRRRVSP